MSWRGWLHSAPRLCAAWSVSALSLASFGAHHCGAAPSIAEREEFADAVAGIRAAQPDFVVVWPPAAAAALEALPADLRAADAVPADPPERRRANRIVVIGPEGFADPPELHEARAAPREHFGGIDVGLYTYPATDRVLFDLRDMLASARVALEGPEHSVVCDRRRDDGGWDCPGRPPWNHVAPATLRVEGRDWRGIWVHPVQRHDLVIELHDQPLGDRIELDGALSDDAAATPGGANVDVALEIHGSDEQNQITKTLRRSNSTGVVTLRVPLPVPGDRGAITLRIRTPRDGRRHFAINLRAVQTARAVP